MHKLFRSLIHDILVLLGTPFYWVLAGLAGSFIGGAWLVAHSIGMETRLAYNGYNEIGVMAMWIFVAGFFIWRLIDVVLIKRPARPLLMLGHDFHRYCLSWRRILGLAPIMITFTTFFAVFTSMKRLIPKFHPFTWDPFFARLDGFIHGGLQPWQLIQPVLGEPAVTSIINIVYNLWFFIKFMTFYWQGFSVERPNLRAQFFLTAMLAWIVNGSILATLFSSAGPCYFHLAFPGVPDPYQGLMQYLHAANEVVPVWSLKTQAYLWERYTDEHSAILTGISAFPSMHVSIAFLFVLLSWSYGRWVRAGFIAFFMFILLGSVHLGWHYAVDGYFSILTTTLLWVLTGKAVRRFRLGEPRMKERDDGLKSV